MLAAIESAVDRLRDALPSTWAPWQIAFAVAIATLAVTTGGIRLAFAGEVLPGVSVAGHDVGGLSPDDAAAALRDQIAPDLAGELSVTHAGEAWTVPLDTIDYRVDIGASVDTAFDVGRGRFGATWRQATSPFTNEDLPLVASWDDNALADAIREASDAIDGLTSVGVLTVSDTLEVQVTPPADLRVVDRVALAQAWAQALRGQGPREVPATFNPLDDPARPEAVARAVADAEKALTQTLVLTVQDRTDEIEPRDLATLLRLEATEDSTSGTATVQLGVDPLALRDLLGERADEIRTQATGREISIDRAPAITFDDQGDTTWRPLDVDVQVVTGTPPLRFEARSAARGIAEMLRAGESEGPWNLVPVESATPSRTLQMTQLLGTFTTRHDCCAGRVTNIQTLADLVDGTIVDAGGQFSVNQLSGVRSCRAGFVPAGTIIRGELVDTCGGGVSQFGTTLFNAAFFAGAQLDQWKAHSAYFSRYPRGREATLNYPEPDIDVRFTNTTDSPMLIRTSYTDTSITVSIYGSDPTLTRVDTTTGASYAFTQRRETRRENTGLPPSTERQVQGSTQGFSVDVTRTIVRDDAPDDVLEFTTVYAGLGAIVEFNPQPAPCPTSADAIPDPAPSAYVDGCVLPGASPSPSTGSPSPGGSPSASTSGTTSPTAQPNPSSTFPEDETPATPAPSGSGTSSPEPSPSSQPTGDAQSTPPAGDIA